MPYRIVMQDDVLRVTFTGTLTPEDLRTMAAQVNAIEQSSDPVPDRIFDFLDITDHSTVLHHEVVDMARERRALVLGNPIRSAVVVSSQVTFGYVRVFQTLMDNPLVTLRIFSSVADAEAWLASPA